MPQAGPWRAPLARLSYSTLVRGLTVALPLVALALLSTLFLVARTAPQESTLPFIEDLQGRATAGDAMRTPFYTGTTENGDAVTVQADLVRPDPSGSGAAQAEGLTVDIRFTDDTALRVTSVDGRFLSEENHLALEGDVVLDSSTGYALRTKVLQADLSRGEAESRGAVQINGPLGTLDAGQFTLRRKSTDAVELVFTNGVKLLYLPPQPSD